MRDLDHIRAILRMMPTGRMAVVEIAQPGGPDVPARYLCGLTGHRVHVVCRRNGLIGFYVSSRTKSTPEPAMSARASSVESASRTFTVNGSPKNICVLTLSMRALTRT